MELARDISMHLQGFEGDWQQGSAKAEPVLESDSALLPPSAEEESSGALLPARERTVRSPTSSAMTCLSSCTRLVSPMHIPVRTGREWSTEPRTATQQPSPPSGGNWIHQQQPSCAATWGAE